MQFSTLILGVMGALAATASAQNPFTFTTLTSIKAETPFNITWSPSTGTTDTVTLILRKGLSTDLDTVATIAGLSPSSLLYPSHISASFKYRIKHSIPIGKQERPEGLRQEITNKIKN